MNSEHLSTGSKCPPTKDGLLRIYNMRYCPYAQRPILVALAKGIPFDTVNCNLKQKPEWLFQMNPEGKVPVLVVPGKDQPMNESLIIADYLDDGFPGRKLQAEDPFLRALDRMWIEKFNATIGLFYRSVYNTCQSDGGAQVELLEKSFQVFEAELGRRRTLFFGGSGSPGMLDYMIWPWIERLPVVQKFYPAQFDFGKFLARYPLIAKWHEGMKKDSAVSGYLIDPDIHYEYALSSKNGAPNYNLLS